jgi:hypothetical protein
MPREVIQRSTIKRNSTRRKRRGSLLYEPHADPPAVFPNDFTGLARHSVGHRREIDDAADGRFDVGEQLRAAIGDVEHAAIEAAKIVIECDPGVVVPSTPH